MAEVSLSVLMGEILSFCPEAVIFEESDGGVAISLMMRLEGDVLVPFDNEEVDDV